MDGRSFHQLSKLRGHASSHILITLSSTFKMGPKQQVLYLTLRETTMVTVLKKKKKSLKASSISACRCKTQAPYRAAHRDGCIVQTQKAGCFISSSASYLHWTDRSSLSIFPHTLGNATLPQWKYTVTRHTESFMSCVWGEGRGRHRKAVSGQSHSPERKALAVVIQRSLCFRLQASQRLFSTQESVGEQALLLTAGEASHPPPQTPS